MLSVSQTNNLGVEFDPFSQIKKKKSIETVTSSSEYFDKYYLRKPRICEITFSIRHRVINNK